MTRLTWRKGIIALSLSLMSFVVYAVVPTWQIVPNESSLTFIGTQIGAPVEGHFKKFSGEISFDPDQLKASKIHIVVDMSSVSLSFSDFVTTLLTPDWFNVAQFPQAVFDSTDFTKTGENQYQANGTLSIRAKKIPVTLDFVAVKLANNQARVSGHTTIKRSQFGIGQGEWADTNTVKDAVEIKFIITASKK